MSCGLRCVDGGRITPPVRRIDQVEVGVAHNYRAGELGDTFDGPLRVGSAGTVIPETDNEVCADVVEVGEDGIEGDRVPVDIGDERDPHRPASCHESDVSSAGIAPTGGILGPRAPRPAERRYA